MNVYPIALSSAELQQRGAAFSDGLDTAPRRLYHKAVTNTGPVDAFVDRERYAYGCLPPLPQSGMNVYPVALSSAELQQRGAVFSRGLGTAPQRFYQKAIATTNADPADVVDREKYAYGCLPPLQQSGMNVYPIALSSAELQQRGAAFSTGLGTAPQRLYQKAVTNTKPAAAVAYGRLPPVPQSGMNVYPFTLSSAELQQRGAAFSAGLDSAPERLYKKAEVTRTERRRSVSRLKVTGIKAKLHRSSGKIDEGVIWLSRDDGQLLWRGTQKTGSPKHPIGKAFNWMQKLVGMEGDNRSSPKKRSIALASITQLRCGTETDKASSLVIRYRYGGHSPKTWNLEFENGTERDEFQNGLQESMAPIRSK